MWHPGTSKVLPWQVSVNPFIRAFEEQRESQEAPHLTHLTTIRLRLQILAVLGHEMSDEEDVLAITDSDVGFIFLKSDDNTIDFLLSSLYHLKISKLEL